jgi:hypothetical protein
MAMAREVGRLREQGLLTSGTAALMLGIKLNRLRALEGKLYEPVPRESKRGYAEPATTICRGSSIRR